MQKHLKVQLFSIRRSPVTCFNQFYLINSTIQKAVLVIIENTSELMQLMIGSSMGSLLSFYSQFLQQKL